MTSQKTLKTLLVLAFAIMQTGMFAQDWPTYQNDNQRSGITNMKVPDKLFLNWEYEAKEAPNPAWPDPAKTDFWHREANLKPRVIYDRAYHVISVGDKVYFGSSANDMVYCLNSKTGEEEWSFFTGGPVRLAPTWFNGNIYVGSDDGVAYCLNAETGELVWKINTAEGKRYLPGNERMISITPIRTGILISDSIAYFASGMFPTEGVDLYAVNALTGDIIWKTPIPVSPQGYMLASKDNLYIPTGRTQPAIFSRKDGSFVGKFDDGNGGTYALLVNDEIVFGAGDEGELNAYPSCSVKEDDEIATFLGLQLIVKDDISYLRSDKELSAIRRDKYVADYKDWAKVEDKKRDLAHDLWDLRERRKKASPTEIDDIDTRISEVIDQINAYNKKRETIESGGLIWKTPIGPSYSMILTGNDLVLGGNGKIDIYNIETGEKILTEKVDGIVYSLAAANGKILASTDKGIIYSFSSKKAKEPEIHKPVFAENPYKDDINAQLYEDAAKRILKESGVEKGYCLVVGSETGHLAYELAKQSNLKIIGIEPNPDKVEKSRRVLDNAGLYGERIAIINADLKKLPLNKYFANLIVSDKLLMSGELETPADEIYRVLKPYGGIALLGVEKGNKQFVSHWIEGANEEWNTIDGWVSIVRGAIPGAGEWTHLYAEPGNTACSNDSIEGPFQIQWFGQPGPREMINRHSRPMSPLFKDGRLFVPGDNRIIVVDAYNGTPLWKRYVPDSRVLGALRDCGTMAVTDDHVYIAAGQSALGFKVENGDQDIVLEAPQVVPGQESKWGYLAIVDDQIFGSGKKPSASVTVLGRDNCDTFEGDYRDMVSSDYLFSMNRKTGEVYWTYRGLVFNNTITIGDEYVYFVESRNPKALLDFDGRLRVDHFNVGPTYIVKLDQRTGEKMWEKEFKFPYSQIMFLAFTKHKLIVTGSFNVDANVHYRIYAFDGGDGHEIWQQEYQGGKIGGSHGEQWQHPVIIGERLFLFPYIFNIENGDRADVTFDKGGCGGFSGSANNLFARNSNPTFYDIYEENREGTHLTEVNRPGCWINIIPAGDIISVPEASSGCTCDYPIQTSFVFISKD